MNFETSKNVPKIPISKNINFFKLFNLKKKQILKILRFGKLLTFNEFKII